MPWYESDRFGFRDRWDASPALHALYPSFNAWANWMLQCVGVDAVRDSLEVFQDQASEAATYAAARLALLRDPVAYLPAATGMRTCLPTIYEDGPDPTLWLYGPIVSELREDLVSPLSVRVALDAASAVHPFPGKTLRLRVSSPGGDMDGAAAIACLLSRSQWQGAIVIEIDHLCHSAAAVHFLPIAARVVMRAGATMMLHEPSLLFWGRASDCRRIAKAQRRLDEFDWRRVADARHIPYSRVRRLALAESFLTAEQALRLGLVDEIAPALPALNIEGTAP